MTQPTLVLWIDSLNEKTHQEERVRLHALGSGVSARAHRLIESKMLIQATIRPENEQHIVNALPDKNWLSPEQIVIWQLSGQLSTDYRVLICVVSLDPTIDEATLGMIYSTVKRTYGDLQIQLDFSLIWYKGDRPWTKGSCANYFPRYAVSDRVTDWQNVVEHLVVASIDSQIGAYVADQGAASVEVVWCGAAALSLGMQHAQETVRENMYRKMVEVLRADDLTQEEVDSSKRVAHQNRVAFARDMMTHIQKQINDNLDFSIEYFVEEHSETPIRLGKPTDPKRRYQPSGFSIRKGSSLGQSLFAARADWWLSTDEDFSGVQMLTELLRKDDAKEVIPPIHETQQLLQLTMTRLHDRVTNVARESSQKSLDTFFAHIFQQIESQSSYGLRNIQQSLADYIDKMESGMLLSFKGTPVPTVSVATGSYFSQLADSIHIALADAMNRITRRRRNSFSLLGSVLRMALIIPILNGVFSIVGPAAYQDLATFLIPVVVLGLGVGSAIASYRQYHVYSRLVRNQFVEDILGKAFLEIIQSVFLRERNRVLTHLRHLNTIYLELIESYDHMHADQVKPNDFISSNSWVLQQIDTVWGETKKLVTSDADNLGDWDLIIGEEVTTYQIDGQTRLSFQSSTQVEVNRDAREKGLYRGSVLLLQQVADQLRRNPLTKEGVETRMRSFCNLYVKRVFENPLNKLHLFYEINRSAQVVMPSTGTRLNRTTMLGDGKHWIWLNTAANQNATPRPDVPATTKNVSVLIIPDFLKGSLEGRYGRPSPNWIEPNIVVPISKAFDEEIIHVRMDVDFVK